MYRASTVEIPALPPAHAPPVSSPACLPRLFLVVLILHTFFA